MKTKKIIPCLDTKGGRVVKGINFVNLRDVGDPVENAVFYEKEGADEIVFLDISATTEQRKTTIELAKRVAEKVSIPFIVGGGISSVSDIRTVLDAGVDKISINTAAVNRPSLIREASDMFGGEHIIVAIDVKKIQDRWLVCINGGKVMVEKEAVSWAKEVESLGAGEILLTSMERDGTKSGYDLDITRLIADAVSIPVTASGGVGSLNDFFEVFSKTKAAAALGASVFHFRELSIPQVKAFLKDKGVEVAT